MVSWRRYKALHGIWHMRPMEASFSSLHLALTRVSLIEPRVLMEVLMPLELRRRARGFVTPEKVGKIDVA